MNRHAFRGSRANRDRREQAFARSVIAAMQQQHDVNEALLTARATEVCPDCFGTGEVARHVSDEVVTDAICLECNGRGWLS